MKNKLLTNLLLATFFAGAVASQVASASIATVADSATFNSLGTISYNTNFSSAVLVGGFNFPGDPYTVGDVTYTSGKNLIVGSGQSLYSIGKSQNVMSYEYWSPVTGTIATAPKYSLFGFDLAVTPGPVNITINTNDGTYSYNGLTIANGNPNFTFMGFETTTPGEYFTGFNITTLGQGYLPGMTNVEVGNIAAVPLPASVWLMLSGLGGLGLLRRRKQQSIAA